MVVPSRRNAPILWEASNACVMEATVETASLVQVR